MNAKKDKTCTGMVYMGATYDSAKVVDAEIIDCMSTKAICKYNK